MLGSMLWVCTLLWMALPTIERFMSRPTYGLPLLAAHALDPELPRAEAQAIAHDCMQANPHDSTALLLCVDWRSDSWLIRHRTDASSIRHRR